MAHISPEQAFEELKKRLSTTVGSYFPVEGNKHALHAKRVWVDDDLHIDDIRSQEQTKLRGRTWAVPIKAEVELRDKKTGEVKDTKVVTVGQLPKITRRYSYIVDGNEWQVANQFRLKPGVYTRIKDNGELGAQWNLGRGYGFEMGFDPKSRQMSIKYGSSNVPLYALLKATGVADDDIERAWGKEVLSANMASSRPDADIRKLYKAMTGEGASSTQDAQRRIQQELDKTELDPTVTKSTLGKAFSKVDGAALLAGSHKMLQVARQQDTPDDRDSLEFKSFHAAEDLIDERLTKRVRWDIDRKLRGRLDRKESVGEIVTPDLFGRALKGFFSGGSTHAHLPEQFNPVSFIAGQRKTTILGQGGISSPDKVSIDAKSMNPSHLGFLDPLVTPESANIGADVGLASAAEKRGTELVTPAFNLKSGKMEKISAARAARANLAFPDQYIWEKGKPRPRSDFVKVISGRGETESIPASEVDYVLPSSKGVLDFASNLIPFIQNDQGNRTSVASRQLEQAVSLVHREAPLVQTQGGGKETYEHALGVFNSHVSPIDGVVDSVSREGIVVRGKDGKKHEVQLYRDFPLNENKSVLNSEPIVKKGDAVKKDQVVADTNYTRDGTLALGTNLRTAYMPYRGLNHEDAVVISESAAKKLTSGHMLRFNERLERNVEINKPKFLAETAGAYTKRQADKLDDEGVVREGQVVEPGDLLIASLKHESMSAERERLGVFSKKLVRPVRPSPKLWDKDYPGTVTRVVKHGRDVTVYVKVETPADIGDKLVGRHGNKGVISRVVSDHEMPHDASGKPMEILLNVAGIPCFDEETEFLTRNGWLRGADLSKEEEFATLNRANFSIEFQRPEEVFHIPYKGKMYSVRNQQLDMLVTPEHKQFTVRRGHKKTYSGFDVNDAEILSLFELKPAHAVFGEPRRYLKAARWKGCSELFYYVPAASLPRSGPLSKGFNVTVAQWAEFMGWFLSEGSTYKVGRTHTVEISQSQSKNPEKCERIKGLVSAMGLSFYQTPGGIRIRQKSLYEKLAPLGGCRQKYIPRDILDMRSEHLTIFLNALMAGDGCEVWNEATGHYGTRTYWTASKQLADGVQEVAAKLGISANIRRENRHGDDACYMLSLSRSCVAPFVNRSSTTKRNQVEEWVDYDAVVHCVTVPNGVLLVRRNGKAVFSGNSRINVGQALETTAAKIAEKTGKPYVVSNFDPKIPDYTQAVRDELKAHGLSDTEDLTDPLTGKVMPAVLTGKQYILKLHHTAEKGVAVRNRGAYDLNMVPKRGGQSGAQKMDISGIYALLAHGARENVREVQTRKADMDDDLWIRLQSGEPLPAPKVPFVFSKFEGYLKAMGVDVQKNGNHLQLAPLTDKQVLAMSAGELTAPATPLRGKDLKPAPGSLFDPKLTGTMWPSGKLGQKWTHITLAERMPNPTFEKATRELLDISQKDFDAIIEGRQQHESHGTGPQAIVAALDKVDVASELRKLEGKLPSLRGANLDRANRKLRYLRALNDQGLLAADAYAMKHIPVLPPNMRPISLRENGDLNEDDLNGIYRAIGQVNMQLNQFDKGLPEEERHPLRAELYDGLRALTLTGLNYKGRHRQGVVEALSGKREGSGSPKEGFFQSKLIGRRQDLSLRGVIVPEPSLALDEVGIPHRAAEEIYKPFLVRRLVRLGYTPLKAQEEIKSSSPIARRVLELESAERPLLLKRDPVLHRGGVQAFRPRLIGGHSIQIHPLVTDAFAADFDGDKMSAFLPISEKAVDEARKMFPSNNLFSSSHGSLMFVPKQEALLGLHRLSRVDRKSGLRFKTVADAKKALRDGKITANDLVTIEDKLDVGEDAKLADSRRSAGTETTLGRLALYQAIPESLREERMLTDPNFVMHKQALRELLSNVAEKERKDFGPTADRLKDLGNESSTGMSFGLEDLAAKTEDRDRLFTAAQKEERKIRLSKGSPEERRKQITALYNGVAQELDRKLKPQFEQGKNRMYDWVRSGARGNWDQFKQMTIAPVQVVDSKGQPIPVPISRSYSEGLDLGSYWTALYGARMGTIGRVEGTAKPGEQFKYMAEGTINQLIAGEDCGTSRGIILPVETSVALGRYTSKGIELPRGKGNIVAGTLVTPDLLSRLRNNKVKDVPVRTPMKCELPRGVCKKCMGVNENGQDHELGVNAGIIAAHAMGEPLTQLAMRSFHEGGVVGTTGARAVDKFTRFTQLTEVPQTLPGAATLATREGKVEKVSPDAAGGWNVVVAGEPHFVPSRRELSVKVGQAVKKGDALSSGPKNPHELLETSGMSAVQGYLADELEKLYEGDSPLHRRNTEVLVRALTSLGRVVDAGDNPDVLRGDIRPVSQMKAHNRKNAGGRPTKFTPILKGTKVLPLEMQTDWIARLQSRQLKNTLLEGAAQGWVSDLHGTHPVPAMAVGASFGEGLPNQPWLY